MGIDRNLNLAGNLASVTQAWLEFLPWLANSDELSAQRYGQVVAHHDRAAYKFLGVSFPLIANPTVMGDDVALEVWLGNPKPNCTDIGPWYFVEGKTLFTTFQSAVEKGSAEDPDDSRRHVLLDAFAEAVLESNFFSPTAPAADKPESQR